MNVVKVVVAVVALMSSASAIAHEVDVAFLVDPTVMQEGSFEAVNTEVERWVEIANVTMQSNGFDVTYNVVTVEIANSAMESDVVQSASYTVSERLLNEPESQESQLRDRFGADYVTYILPDADGYGITGSASGNAASAVAFTAPDSTWAHEAGHNADMRHPSNEDCATANYLMCQTGQGRDDSQPLLISVENGVHLNNSINNMPAEFSDWTMMGHISAPQQILGESGINSVFIETFENGVGNIDFTVALLDAERTPLVLEETVSVEVYIKGENTVPGEDYSDAFIQRVEFLAGETTKDVSLELSFTPSALDKTIEVGTRYGEKVSALGAAYTITVEGTVDQGDNSGGDGTSGDRDSGGGGGSLGWFGLLALAGLGILRVRHSMRTIGQG